MTSFLDSMVDPFGDEDETGIPSMIPMGIPPKPSRLVVVPARLSKDERAQLAVIAGKQGLTVSQLVRRMIQEGLARMGKESNNSNGYTHSSSTHDEKPNVYGEG